MPARARVTPIKRAAKTASTPPPDIEVFDPAYEAHKLRMQGVAWREVAARSGYATPADAIMSVRRYLTQAAAEIDATQKQEALRLQLDRYEAVLSAWWAAGTNGAPLRNSLGVVVPGVTVMDEKAGNMVLKTLAQIDRLHNFDADTASSTPEIIVIGGSEQEYTEGLRAIVDTKS